MLFCLGGGVETPIQSYRRGLWKSYDIQEFISGHRYFLEQFLPSLKKAPGKGTVLSYLAKYISPVQFGELFIEWSKEISQHYESIKPCDDETVKIGFNTFPHRPIILAVHEWKIQNPSVEKIVDELFSSVGKGKARMALR